MGLNGPKTQWKQRGTKDTPLLGYIYSKLMYRSIESPSNHKVATAFYGKRAFSGVAPLLWKSFLLSYTIQTHWTVLHINLRLTFFNNPSDSEIGVTTVLFDFAAFIDCTFIVLTWDFCWKEWLKELKHAETDRELLRGREKEGLRADCPRTLFQGEYPPPAPATSRLSGFYCKKSLWVLGTVTSVYYYNIIIIKSFIYYTSTVHCPAAYHNDHAYMKREHYMYG